MFTVFSDLALCGFDGPGYFRQTGLPLFRRALSILWSRCIAPTARPILTLQQTKKFSEIHDICGLYTAGNRRTGSPLRSSA